MKNLKEKVLEIVKVAQECPENLQQICFEVLLTHVLQVGKSSPGQVGAEVQILGGEEKKQPESIVEQATKRQDDLKEPDVHVKVRKFLDKNGLCVSDLNQLFYKEAENILPLYDDLGTTRTSESQVRIALLQCLHNAMHSGTFQTSVEEIRTEATTRKCYDVNNWGNNFTNNAALFDFARYSKKVNKVTLSEQGKTELGKVIQELK